MSCSYNNITVIENLPLGLRCFDYIGNIIEKVDNVDIERIRFKLTGYTSIKILQKRYKRRHLGCINFIQECIHLWVWKPLTDDYKLGVRLRIDLEDLLEADT